MAKKLKLSQWLQSGVVRVCKLHFVLVAVYAAYIIASDATHLITPERVLDRWTMAGILLAVSAVAWYLASSKGRGAGYYKTLLFSLISADIALASFSVYTQRGMASRAVILFVIPILVSALLVNRTAVWTVAILSATAYSLSAVKYFADFFNEGYKAELYIEVGFYCAVMFLVAGLIDIVLGLSKPKTD